LDAAPTGHLIRLLEMPELIDRWLKAIFGVLLKYRGILRLPDVSERLVVLSKALKQFRAMLSDRARASLYAVTVPTEMAAAETADLLAACKRMAVSTPVLFLNQVTRNAPCSFCSALEHRESSVQDELIAAFPSVHQAVVYRCGEPRGMEHLAELGRLLYQERPGTR
jgi:arsenite-transporting ATPase